jgi:hypothetical protein
MPEYEEIKEKASWSSDEVQYKLIDDAERTRIALLYECGAEQLLKNPYSLSGLRVAICELYNKLSPYFGDTEVAIMDKELEKLIQLLDERWSYFKALSSGDADWEDSELDKLNVFLDAEQLFYRRIQRNKKKAGLGIRMLRNFTGKDVKDSLRKFAEGNNDG